MRVLDRGGRQRRHGGNNDAKHDDVDTYLTVMEVSSLMFGVNVIAERAIADQGIMILGAETLDANFTQTTSQNFISPASLDIIGNSEFSAFAAGTTIRHTDG